MAPSSIGVRGSVAIARITSSSGRGFELAKSSSSGVHAGIFSGQFEFGGNIMPLWQAYTPAPHEQEYICVDSERATGKLSSARWRWHLYAASA